MKLLIVIPVCANDALLAERHLDFIFRLNQKTPRGSCLLVFNADLHAEMIARLRVSAELAFEQVRETMAPKLSDNQLSNKFLQLNNMFRHAAAVAQKQCRWPWLWLEPDCVPVQPDWIARLAEAYDSQPAKYVGFMSKNPDGSRFMARLGIYFTGASHELDMLCQGEVPFAIATASVVAAASTHTFLIQYVNIQQVDDLKNISKAAVVIHGDKAGIFQENWKQPVIEYAQPVIPAVPEPETTDANEARTISRSRRRQAATA
jgi:hypothetical protein